MNIETISSSRAHLSSRLQHFRVKLNKTHVLVLGRIALTNHTAPRHTTTRHPVNLARL